MNTLNIRLWSFTLLNFLGISFVLLDPRDQFKFISSLYGIPFILLIGISYLLPIVWPIKNK